MILRLKNLVIVSFLILSFSNYSQSKYQFLQEKRKKQTINFELINNLIVVPVEINKKRFSFILDTGVSKTILFNIEENDSLQFKNVKKSRIQGLGKGNAIQALITSGNKVSLENIVNYNEEIYVILKSYFDFSAKMGTEIHGILGYNLLKDFIIKIDYRVKKLHFYNRTKYTIKKCGKCEILPISIHNKKPYLDINIQLDTVGNSTQKATMLIDSGGTESLWLFENSEEHIKTPKRYFNDILGEGLSGVVYGNRSRIPNIKIGSFHIDKPTASFLDSITTQNARKFKKRSGSIGAEILKRFKIWLNYSENKIMLKKNSSFKDQFHYNMSGIDLVYNGEIPVKEKLKIVIIDSFGRDIASKNTASYIDKYVYKLKPSYRIREVVKESPAYMAGLKKNDIVLNLNGIEAHQLKLSDFFYAFQEKDNKKIQLLVKRKGKILNFEFRLKQRI